MRICQSQTLCFILYHTVFRQLAGMKYEVTSPPPPSPRPPPLSLIHPLSCSIHASHSPLGGRARFSFPVLKWPSLSPCQHADVQQSRNSYLSARSRPTRTAPPHWSPACHGSGVRRKSLVLSGRFSSRPRLCRLIIKSRRPYRNSLLKVIESRTRAKADGTVSGIFQTTVIHCRQ